MKSYTFVRATERAIGEVHATGCRDLAATPREAIVWEQVATCAAQAIVDADMDESDVKVNACTCPVRMAAAGRGDVRLEKLIDLALGLN